MPLSEHEQRLLEQMERALYAEDPKLASQLRGAERNAGRRRRVGLAGIGLLIGIGLLLGGVIAQIPLLGILGFIQMLVSVTYVVSTWSRPAPAAGPSTPGARPRARAGRGGGSFMAGVEERWRRRRDQGGR